MMTQSATVQQTKRSAAFENQNPRIKFSNHVSECNFTDKEREQYLISSQAPKLFLSRHTMMFPKKEHCKMTKKWLQGRLINLSLQDKSTDENKEQLTFLCKAQPYQSPSSRNLFPLVFGGKEASPSREPTTLSKDANQLND